MTTLDDSTPLPVSITIPLTRGYVTVIDDIDADLAAFNWRVELPPGGWPYAVRSTRIYGEYRLHRIILARLLGRPLAAHELPDHVDGDGLNNRRSNLRLATYTQNVANTGIASNNTSGFKGVTWHKHTKKYHAKIQVNRRKISLGYYHDPKEAHAAYAAAARKYFGEFANDGEGNNERD